MKIEDIEVEVFAMHYPECDIKYVLVSKVCVGCPLAQEWIRADLDLPKAMAGEALMDLIDDLIDEQGVDRLIHGDGKQEDTPAASELWTVRARVVALPEDVLVYMFE